MNLTPQEFATGFNRWQPGTVRQLAHIERRAIAAPPPGDDPREYVMSDESIDRMGDVISSEGWRLDNFKRNPIALFGHDPKFYIGNWRDVAVRSGQLRGWLILLDPVSERLKELHAAQGAGVLRAVSVGFHPHEYKQLPGSKVGGLHFLDQELVECSLCSVPANPNALEVAKALGISREGMGLIFGALPELEPARPRGSGELARTQHFIPKGIPQMTGFAERIANGEQQLVAARDRLMAIDQDDTDALQGAIGEVNSWTEKLTVWRDGQRAAGEQSEIITRPGRQLIVTGAGGQTTIAPVQSAPPRPAWAQPKTTKEPAPGHLFMRYCVAKTLAHLSQGEKSPADILLERYGNYSDWDQTKQTHEWYTRAATAPATTTTTGWAAELAQVMYGDFVESLMPNGIYGPLVSRGFRVTLGRNGTISMPTRQATPTVAGSFVAEGAPIPVRQAAFVPITLGLKKMGVISTYTAELYNHSTPNIELILRKLMQDDTQVSVDTILIDANPATSIRPAGLRNGVAGLTATAGGGFTALVGDIKALVGALAAVNGLRQPVWVMNDQQVVSIALTQNAGGNFPFQDQVNGGTLLTYPLIKSTTVPLGTVMLVASEEIMSTTGDEPTFTVSDQATLHMEDTTPLAIGTAGAPATVAAPTRSLFQTDSIALRMILPMNWAMMRANMIAWTSSVTW